MKKAALIATLFVSTPALANVTFYDSKVLFDAAAATILIENFDDFSPTDTEIYSSITRGIATYTPLSGSPAPNLFINGTNTVYNAFGANLNPFTGTVLNSSGDEDIMVSFSTPLTAAGFDGYLNGLGVGNVKVFSDGNLLGTLNLPDPVGGGKIFVGITSDTPFNSFQWTTTGGGTLSTAIDTITVATVPIPAAGWLLGSALAGLLTIRNRYSKKV
ncbi:MAG: hypothetical protein ABL903_19665 [Methylococcales bacterium]